MTSFEWFYLALIVLVCIYGVHRYWLVWGAMCARRGGLAAPMHAAGPLAGGDPPEIPPRVLVQLPIYNEPDVCQRLVQRAAALRWPRDRLEIQVLDDSTDGSSALVAEEVRHWRQRGLAVTHVRRGDRTGYKAGALEHGLASSEAEFVAIFDADFHIPPDFLQRAMAAFDANDIAMVQARWGFVNRDRNWLTRVQALMLDGHFRVEHRARHHAGRFFNFNGTAGVWRRTAIQSAGGWRATTITEDLDLSLRAWLAGWRFRYLDDLEVPSELPEQMSAFKIQQNRWVSGSIHTAVTALPGVLRSNLGLAQKLDLSLYLTGNSTYLLLLLLVTAVPAAVLLRFGNDFPWLWADVPFFALATVSVYTFYGCARGWREASTLRFAVVLVPALMALGLGMTLHNARAVLRGAWGRSRVFERTPKGRRQVVERPLGRRRDWVIWCEAFMALYVLASAGLSTFGGGNLVSLPFLLLFVAGYGYVFLQSYRATRS